MEATLNKQKTVYPILFAVCFGHFLNDCIQSILPSVYPMLQQEYSLSFAQIGFITFVFQVTASLLQPFVGYSTDKYPRPYSFVFGMVFSLAGILLLTFATGFFSLLLAAGTIGIGSSIFHPEASKVSYFASGGRRGLAQSIFQLGGNSGYAVGPLLIALIVVDHGQHRIIWFSIAAILGMIILLKVGGWYKRQLSLIAAGKRGSIEIKHDLSKKRVYFSVGILLLLLFSKYFYTAGITNFFTFYLIDQFGVSVKTSQYYLFLFMGAVAAGTLLGGWLGDKFGRKIIIWFSILGAAPFALALPYANLFWVGILIVIIGIITSSAFSAILVYAQELLPGKIGMVSGLFYGFAFGMGGLGSAFLGYLVDKTSIEYVFMVCSFLPLIGIVTVFLPNFKPVKR